jgi:hypothetical protein
MTGKDLMNLNRANDTLNGTAIDNSIIKGDVDKCPKPSNQINMTIGMNCPGYEPLVSEGTFTNACTVSCNSCHNFKNNKCVVNLYDKVLAGIDDSK